ncbi:MAG: class I SAM-dependent methyltransferase [Nitrospina sp.]|nr:class I SAM-dependent methyltransferase [Nitrospina sp.]
MDTEENNEEQDVINQCVIDIKKLKEDVQEIKALLLHTQTIDDYSVQWTKYTHHEGYYASNELFEDIIEPLLTVSDIKGSKVADIGSGNGRTVDMLLGAEPSKVLAVEPSNAFQVLEGKFKTNNRVQLLNAPGDKLPPESQLDYVISLGVIHHIPKPDPVVRAAYNALKPGGKIFIWLYGKEGNRLYLFFVTPLRYITKHLPHFLLVGMSWMFDLLLFPYIKLCKILPLPMQKYMVDYLDKLPNDDRRLTIYDQLNPYHAKYYTRQEATNLLERNGFSDIKTHQRHGYSWSVLGTKPS